MNNQEKHELLIKIVHEFQQKDLVCLVFKTYILIATKDATIRIKSDILMH